MQRVDSKVAELEKKIELELKIKAGAESIKSKLVNPSHVEQAEISLNESSKRLNFLYAELDKLTQPQLITVKSDSLSSICIIDEMNSPKSPLTQTELTAEKIAYKLSEIQYKVSIEQLVINGAEKMIAAIDKKLKVEAENTLRYSKSKMLLLKSILAKYNSLNIDTEDCKTPSSIYGNAKKEITAITGKLKIRIYEASNVNLTSSNNPKNEGYCTIRIDNVLKSETKTKAKLVWNEDFDLKIEKASEIEICLFDKNDILKGMLFFKLPSLFNAASGTAEIQEEFELEPCGKIRCFLQFEKKSEKKFDVNYLLTAKQSKLARRKVIKRKTHVVMGHEFVATKFYHVMKCCVCFDFLLSASGYQCQTCQFTCHKKCHTKVVCKCISSDAPSQLNQIHRIKFNIPHRFETASLAKPSWCCHCGHLLPLAKKSVRKCAECSVTSHEKCVNLVPDFCGLSLELIEKLLSEEKVTVPRKSSISSLDSKISEIERKFKGAHIPSIDDFEFLSVLGKGNFGKVMLAEEKSTKELFAIKVLKKDFILENDEVESLKSEKRIFLIANSDHHPFLVNLHSCFQSEVDWFCLRRPDGGDLMWHIQRQSFSERQAKLYAAEVLLALEYFHKNNVVYRDLKLDNILLGLDGHIKIADYGLCKENMPYGSVTYTFCGTPEFMAPEILMEQSYTRAVDWWALGVLIYEMLLGQSPFKGHSEDEIFQSILSDSVIYPPSLSLEALSILRKLLNRDPVRRLGASKMDAEEIKKHPFFREIDFEALLLKKKPGPYLPKIQSLRDTSNFDEEFTTEEPVLTPINSILHAAEQEEFKGFSYVADWVKN